MPVQELEKIFRSMGFQPSSDPKWHDVRTGRGYLCSFFKLRQNIVYSTGRNSMKLYSADDFFSILDNFVAEESISIPFVLIRDMAEAEGMVLSGERVRQAGHLRSRVGIIGACIYCNCSFLVSNLIRLAGLGYSDLMGFHVARDSEAALRKATELVESNPAFLSQATFPVNGAGLRGSAPDPSGKLRFDMIEFPPELKYDCRESGFSYITGFIRGKVLFSSLSGSVTDRDLEQIAPIMDKALTMGGFAGKRYHRVADYSGLGNISIFHQKKYACIVRDIHKRHDCTVIRNYICGASAFLTGALRIFSNFVNMKMLFTQTVDQAFDTINLSAAGKFPPEAKTCSIAKDDLDKLIDLLSCFLFETGTESASREIPFPPEHPLFPIAEAFTLVRADLEEIKSKEERAREELKSSENELLAIQNLRRIGTMAGGIAHDFNNVLTGIFGNLSMLRRSLPADHRGMKYLEKAEKSLERASGMTGQLLVLSKGGIHVREVVNLNRLIRDLVTFDLAGSSVKPIFEVPDGIWSVMADKGQLQQVFSNLVINAMDAMPDGGKLTISMKNVELVPGAREPAVKSGKFVMTSVADEGSGIAPSHMSLIFDPYFTTKKTGSGLGLATVFSIVNNHGGFVKVESVQGKGTRFTVHLPASVDTGETVGPETAEKTHNACVAGGPGKILVMDDDEVIRDFVVDVLIGEGVDTIGVADGASAVSLYENSFRTGVPFDAVILDLTIPGGMGGVETLRRLLEIDPQVKAIVSSGYADEGIMADPQSHGFKGCVIKPYTAERLLEELASVMESGERKSRE